MTVPQTKAMLPLNDGCDMPQFGLSSYRNDDIKLFQDLMVQRLEQGIRHIEVSDLFGNGHFAVECVLDGDLDICRQDIFLTFKIWPKNRKYQELIDSFLESLHFMGVEYVDLLLIHAPIDITNRLDQWKALEFLKNEGFAKSIGGCSMTNAQLSNLIKVCTVIPAVVEMEVTPFGQKLDIVEFCLDNGIVVMSDHPLAKDINYDHHQGFREICESLDMTPQQVLIKWAVTKGYAVMLPPSSGSVGPDLSLYIDSTLPDEIMEVLDMLDENQVTAWETNEEGGGDDGE